jgi:hypothetical protein
VILVFFVVIRSDNVVITLCFVVIVVDSVVKKAKSVVITHNRDLITDEFAVRYLFFGVFFYETG